jgi:hypothetical protein
VKRRQQGYTLIELGLVIGLSVMIAAGLVGMFQAHVQTMNQAIKYQFLAKDAPFIGLLLTRTMGNADDYRIYSSRGAAISGGTPILTGQATLPATGPAIRLWMRQPNANNSQPNSSFRQAILSVESINNHWGIFFFLADPNTGAFSSAPNWELAGSPTNTGAASNQLTTVKFDASTGVLLVTLSGPNNDWYQFAAEKK